MLTRLTCANATLPGPCTANKPEYRRLGDDGLDHVLRQIDQYASDKSMWKLSWTFAGRRQQALHDHLTADIAKDDEPRLVPLRGGKVRALTRLLTWLNTSHSAGLEKLTAALASDLQARFSRSKTLDTPLQLAEQYRAAADHAAHQNRQS